MIEFIFPNDWDDILKKAGIVPNKDFNNFCEDYNQEDFNEILKEEGVDFFWREYTELLKMKGNIKNEN